MKRPDDALQILVDGWLHKADQDLLAAERLQKHEAVLGGIVAFHAQQAAEKYMKAVLTKHQVEFPKTHDLGVLVTLLMRVRPSVGADLAQVTVLTDYGVEVRYPGDLPDLDAVEVQKAIEMVYHTKATLMTLL